MLITRVRPNELWGKKVYDTDGRYLGAVVAIASRRGVIRKVVVQRKTGATPVRLLPSPEAYVDGSSLVFPVVESTSNRRLRVVG
jgi:sporulation protein YlmC with PRC-barrel domain